MRQRRQVATSAGTQLIPSKNSASQHSERAAFKSVKSPKIGHHELLTSQRVGVRGRSFHRADVLDWIARGALFSMLAGLPPRSLASLTLRILIHASRVELASGPPPESPCRCLLYGIEISVGPIVRIHGKQRRLGQESRTLTLVRLRSMHQEWMTQIHRTRVAGGRDHGAMRARGKSVGGKFPQRQTLFSRGRQLPSDVRV